MTIKLIGLPLCTTAFVFIFLSYKSQIKSNNSSSFYYIISDIRLSQVKLSAECHLLYVVFQLHVPVSESRWNSTRPLMAAAAAAAGGDADKG